MDIEIKSCPQSDVFSLTPEVQKRRDILLRPLLEDDLSMANHIYRLAFGTFLGHPEPENFGGDNDFIRSRWAAYPTGALGAEVRGELIGANLASNWGSVGFFGPLMVRPDLWEAGIATFILEATMELFVNWNTEHIGLFTFAQSAKHIGLYQKFGFWPRFLTAIMSKPVRSKKDIVHWSRYSEMPDSEQTECLNACRKLTDMVYNGLDLNTEIRIVNAHDFGETVLIRQDNKLAGFAVCHCGAGTEAGSDTCYIKFGVVRPCPVAGQIFDHLLDVCESLAVEQGMSRLVAGVNTARHNAYLRMIAHGFRTDLQGVAMQKPNEPGYNCPEIYIIDDWR
ncbi:MAG: GNAT family N-acetyltransferase [Thermodesulfobacteriota bacterium]|nr:GNAT family N-acetyltransferase [Thermodesulfobacteriota bacterium]